MFRLFLCCLLATLFCSCSKDYEFSEKDRLSPQEEDAVVAYVRGFIRHNKKIKLSREELDIVMTRKPDFAVNYSGPKQGQLSIRWSLPNYRVILLQRTGKLLSEDRADWIIRLITDNATGKLPKDSFGAQGEELSLPPL